jgi:hypothetical protein
MGQYQVHVAQKKVSHFSLTIIIATIKVQRYVQTTRLLPMMKNITNKTFDPIWRFRGQVFYTIRILKSPDHGILATKVQNLEGRDRKPDTCVHLGWWEQSCSES